MVRLSGLFWTNWKLLAVIAVLITAALTALAGLPTVDSLDLDWDTTTYEDVLQFWLVALVLFTVAMILAAPAVRTGRRWHGVDWWLAIISMVFLAFFLVLGIIPEHLAPYHHNESIGPGFLAPMEDPPLFILIAREDLDIQSFADVGRQLEEVDGEYRLSDQITERASRSNAVGNIDDSASETARLIKEQLGLTNAIDTGRRLKDDETEQLLTPRQALEALLATDYSTRRPMVALIGRQEVFTPLVDDYEGLRIVGRVGPDYPTPLLGTNNPGEDVFSRLIFGARTTLIIGLGSALFSCIIGIPLGLVSGYVGGILDRVFSLVMDSLYSFPGLVLAIAIAVVLGRGIFNVILAIAVIYVPIYYRIVRSQTLAIREMAYVEAARSLGERQINILFRYIFPNVIASVVVIFSINVADAILTGAGLSFLGLGLPENQPDWGVDLARNQQYLRSEWWLVVFPGIAITWLVLSFSLLGESLSEILNPRLNRA